MTAFDAYLRLARISNLPTVWSNVLAASALAGGLAVPGLLVVMLAASLLYTAGMFLNDAFDERIDARERPGRPLPSRAVTPSSVWIAGSAMLLAGVLLLSGFGATAGIAGAALAASVIVYDAWHKGNPVAPFVMGLCRALVYVATAAAVGSEFSTPLIAAALTLLAYVAGLTFAAREESFDRVGSWWPLALLGLPILRVAATAPLSGLVIGLAIALAGAIAVAVYWLIRRLPGDVGRAVSLLIAAIALADAMTSAAAGNAQLAFVCCGLFVATLLLQRVIPGT